MEMKPELVQKLEALEKKFSAMGQDILSYLDGLLYADYLTYWDYIHVDTLLSLQNPKTSFPMRKFSSCTIRLPSCISNLVYMNTINWQEILLSRATIFIT